MGTAQDDGVDKRVCSKKSLDAIAHKVVGPWFVVLAVLYDRHPHRTGKTCDMAFGIQFLDFQPIGIGLDGSGSGENTYMAALCQLAHNLCSGTNDAQHTSVGSIKGKILLLYRAQGLCGSRVAPQHNQRASQTEEFTDSLESKLIDNIKRTGSVGSAGVIA